MMTIGDARCMHGVYLFATLFPLLKSEAHARVDEQVWSQHKMAQRYPVNK